MQISNWQLTSFSLFVVLVAYISYRFRLDLEKSILIGSARTYIQLLVMGSVLVYVFKYPNPIVSLLLYIWMIFWAAKIICSRIIDPPFKLFPMVFTTMLFTYTILNVLCMSVFLNLEAWYAPQFFITIGGMIIGNSMNALALSLERLFSDIKIRRDELCQNLILGMKTTDAMRFLVRDALKAGMTPSINQLSGVGLVFIPGMMTGQILGGEDPLNAAKYQILIMLIICVSTAIGSVLVINCVAKKCFNKNEQLNF